MADDEPTEDSSAASTAAMVNVSIKLPPLIFGRRFGLRKLKPILHHCREDTTQIDFRSIEAAE